MAEEHSLELEHAAIELSPSYVQDHSDRANLAISNNVQVTLLGISILLCPENQCAMLPHV